jgi:hypothetical protein
MGESQLRVGSWCNELYVRESPAGKNVSMEAEDTVSIRHKETTDKDTEVWEDLVCPIVISDMQ